MLEHWIIHVEKKVSMRVTIDWIPITLLLVVLLPLLLLTLIIPVVLAPILAIISVPFLYGLTKGRFQDILFNFDRQKAHWVLIMPLEIIILVWGLLLMATGKIGIVMSVVGIFSLLIVVAIFPALRFRLSKKTPRFSYSIRFWIMGSLVMSIQFFNLVRYL